MLHKVHMGAHLSDPAGYGVAGFSGASTWEHVEFPATPGGVAQCARCLGGDTWHQPTDRDHDVVRVHFPR